jgi:hypothetical protein
VTFLHLFHHSSITVVVGSILPFDYNGDMYLPIMLNSANHMLVYLHYLLATLGLQSWWAPYITSLQLSQFCIIFAQSLLSYRVGPTCGSPDFAKVLMILYMGSMVALFGNFFLQRYVLRRPYTGLDMCGVIKSPVAEAAASTQLCGIAKLNAYGCCVVLLSPEFPDPESTVRSSSGGSGALLHAPFTVAYHLTALGAPMPQLHISTEVTRFSTSVWKSLSISSGEITEDVNSCDSGIGGTTKSVVGLKKRVTTQPDTEEVRIKREQDLEQEILRNYWAKNRITTNTANSGNNGSKMGRSVSTGNIPALYSSPLRAAKSTGSFLNMHNDRLIDLPLLGRLRGLAADTMCQLDRGVDDDSNSDEEREEAVTAPSSSTFDPRGKSENPSITKSEEKQNKNRDPLLRGGPVPLCFTISGGKPHGRISWLVTSVPQPSNNRKEDSSDELKDRFADEERKRSKDWRAL